MKATPFTSDRDPVVLPGRRPITVPRVTVGTRRARALLAALVPAVTVAIAALVAVSSGGTALLCAALWGAGLALLAVAVDLDGARAAAHAALGTAVAAFAWLGHAVTPEFALLAALAVAAWLGAATGRALLRR